MALEASPAAERVRRFLRVLATLIGAREAPRFPSLASRSASLLPARSPPCRRPRRRRPAGPSTAEPAATTTQKQSRRRRRRATRRRPGSCSSRRSSRCLRASGSPASASAHLVPERAEKAVQTAFNKPLARRQIDKLRLRLDPTKLATPYVTGAVGHARAAKPGHERAARRLGPRRRRPRLGDEGRASASTAAGEGRPRAPARQAVHRPTRATAGTLDQNELVQRVVHALSSNTRLPVRVDDAVAPAAGAAGGHGRRDRDQPRREPLSLFHGDKPWRTFRVATGQAIYPTPRGRFHIVVK